jgi:hypothetical protein
MLYCVRDSFLRHSEEAISYARRKFSDASVTRTQDVEISTFYQSQRAAL